MHYLVTSFKFLVFLTTELDMEGVDFGSIDVGQKDPLRLCRKSVSQRPELGKDHTLDESAVCLDILGVALGHHSRLDKAGIKLAFLQGGERSDQELD